MSKTAVETLYHRPWYKNDNSIWLFTTYELRRNLKTHLFTPKLEPEYQDKLNQMLIHALQEQPKFKNLEVCPLKESSPLEKQSLYEYFFPESDFLKYNSQEQLLLDPKNAFYIGLNLEDHLQFFWLDTQNDLEKKWNQIYRLESKLQKSLDFAFHPKFGFLSPKPQNAGMGMQITFFLHLPLLIQTQSLEEKLSKLNTHFFQISGMGGEKDHYLGDLILIRNQHSFAVTEEAFIKNMQRVLIDLSSSEKKLRQEALKNPNSALLDQVSKAFGILQHATRLNLKEALFCMSLCKLGIEMNWLKGLSILEINTLFFSVRKGALTHLNLDKTTKDIESHRAEYVKQAFKKVSLNF